MIRVWARRIAGIPIVLLTMIGCGAANGTVYLYLDGSAASVEAGGAGGADDAAASPEAPGGGDGPAATLSNGQCATGAYHHNGGACQCTDGAPDVCGGACTNVAVDSDNCGLCGLACGPSATCNEGLCGPAPTDLVPASANPACGSIDLAVADGTLYWAERATGLVVALDLLRGQRTTLSAGADSPTDVAVAGSNVFWIEGGQTIHGSADNQTSHVVFRASQPIGGYVVSPDGATIYFTTGSQISSVSSAGGASVVVARRESGGELRRLALSGAEIAFTEASASGLFLVTLEAGVVASCGGFDATTGKSTAVNCSLVARDYNSDYLVLFAGGMIVWGEGTGLHVSSGIPGAPMDLIASGGAPIVGLAATSDAAYASEFEPPPAGPSDEGLIERAPLAPDQTFVVLARAQRNPRSLAVDATRVYWSTDDCAIRATPR
jgi:hypothetical protein